MDLGSAHRHQPPREVFKTDPLLLNVPFPPPTSVKSTESNLNLHELWYEYIPAANRVSIVEFSHFITIKNQVKCLEK